jgi:hypothetical protein
MKMHLEGETLKFTMCNRGKWEGSKIEMTNVLKLVTCKHCIRRFKERLFNEPAPKTKKGDEK